MKIGPLVSPPPLVTFLSGLGGALTAAGVMRDRQLITPSGVGRSCCIEYDNGVDVYASFERMFDISPKEEYRGASDRSAAESGFMEQIDIWEEINGMTTSDIASAIQRPSFFGDSTPEDLDEMVSRLDNLGSATVGDLLSRIAWSPYSAGSRLWRSLGTAAACARCAAEGSLRAGPGSGCEPAAFYFVAGLLFALSGEDALVEPAGDCFMTSIRIFADKGLHATAAMAAEAVVRMTAERLILEGEEGISDLAVDIEAAPEHIADIYGLHVDAMGMAASRWLSVAEGAMERDKPAAAVALRRGMLAALCLDGPEHHHARMSYHSLAAKLNEGRGRHAESARDHLRIAFSASNAFDGSAEGWGRIADALNDALGALERAKDTATWRQVREIEKFARRKSETFRRKLIVMDALIAEDPRDPKLRHDRGFLRLAHGDLGGALSDMEDALDHDEGNPWLISSLAVVHHHFARYLEFRGDGEGAEESIRYAIGYLNTAQAIVDETGIETPPIIHARRGAIFATIGRYEEAMASLEEAHFMSYRDEEIEEYLRAVKKLAQSSIHLVQ